ncbi:MAG: papain-like cysteine protease family protein [Flavobacterium sp.]|uniref:papain-like cysteine protease family protein n=1 Tax=Flavobacterium sp. TaxID=239 RepID=UPI003BE21FDF
MQRVSTILLLFFCFSFNITFGQGEIYQIGDENNYAAAVKTEKFQYFAATQEYDNWCWAACIQMVLNYQGLYVNQCSIVKKAFNINQCVNRAADCNTIQTGTSGWNINGRVVQARVDFSASVYKLIDQLAFKDPVIIGLNMPGQNVGHAYVLTAVFFQKDSNQKKIPYKVVLRDPWPTNPSRHEFGWNDFVSRINCITYVSLN